MQMQWQRISSSSSSSSLLLSSTINIVFAFASVISMVDCCSMQLSVMDIEGSLLNILCFTYSVWYDSSITNTVPSRALGPVRYGRLREAVS